MHSIAWLSRVEQYDFFFVIVFTVVGFSHSVVKMVCFPSTFQLSHNLFLRCANFLLWCINTEFESLSYNWATRMFSGACWSFAGFTDITVSSTRMPPANYAHFNFLRGTIRIFQASIWLPQCTWYLLWYHPPGAALNERVVLKCSFLSMRPSNHRTGTLWSLVFGRMFDSVRLLYNRGTHASPSFLIFE